MPELCVKIIDTPQFQRLRNIKQLGGCYHVYPGASHNRFEHSIGTAHLAGCLVESLKTRQGDLPIDEKDVLCVKIAGLCHDLGHGPFSHLFDGSFIKQALKGTDDESWKHEKASLKMFHSIYESLESDFKDHGLEENDATFIKELIYGPLIKDEDYKGRSKEKWFLYEIISNKENGIDVDKWDYFARDCLHLGMKSGFDHMRCIKMARVIQVGERRHICFRDKEVNNIYEMFHLRAILHRRAYQHKTSNAVGHMITEALLKADPYLLFEGKDGKMLKMSEAIGDMVAYTKLTDQVYYQILHAINPLAEEVKEAKAILERIEGRKLYRLIGEHTATEKDMSKICPTQSDEDEDEDEDAKKEEILEEAKISGEVTKEDIILDVVKFDYSMKKMDPVSKVYFYKKQNPDEAFQFKKDEVSYMLPRVFIEWKIRLYLRKELDETESKQNKLTKQLREGFDAWFQKQQGAGGGAADNRADATPEKPNSTTGLHDADASVKKELFKK